MVEDDDRLARLTAKYLESHGLVVTRVADGESGLREAVKDCYHVVLLDLMLPKMDGVAVCRELRGRCDIPVIMVTARGEEVDRVLGLEEGADDYIPKPFSSRELLARIRAQVRRARGQAGPSRRIVQVGALRLDPTKMTAEVNERSIELTSYEFELLHALAGRAGRVLSREQLLDLVRGNAEQAFDRSIDVHISRLRRKLGDDSRRPKMLKTVRGAGYMLCLETGV